MYAGYSVFLLKHLTSKFGSIFLYNHFSFHSKDLKSAATLFKTPKTETGYKNTVLFQTKNFIYYVNNKIMEKDYNKVVTGSVEVLTKMDKDQQHRKLISSSKALSGKVISILAGYNSPLSNHHLIIAIPPKIPSRYLKPSQYELNLFTENFSKSAIKFKPLEGSKSS